MSAIYFNCRSGISGDMVVGALLDLGVDASYLTAELRKLDLSGYSINARKVYKKGVAATKFDVFAEPGQPQRCLPEIDSLIEESILDDKVKNLSQEIFRHLARSEASVHKTAIEKVQFHEVGAVDSIIDIVSAAILLEKTDVIEAYCSTISLGRGKTMTDHGVIGIPSPAVRHLLKGVPTTKTGISAELTTPTGAAIIKTIAVKYTDTLPDAGKKGYGAGTKDLAIPNVLEVVTTV